MTCPTRWVFCCPQFASYRPGMLNDIRDWLGFAIVLVSFILPFITGHGSRRYHERFRSFKGFGIEWTSFDRDDRQS